MDAEWDEKKRLSNIEKHGVDFDDAASIFEGPTVDLPSRKLDYGEERFAVLGEADEKILFVVYTWRGDRRRIISARKAGSDERERYYKGIA